MTEPSMSAESIPAAGEDLVGSRDAGPTALRGSVLLGVSYAASIGLSLISVPLLIRHLGNAAFGRYTTVIALVTIVGGFTDAGLFNIALREWSTSAGGERDRLMRSLIGIRLELSLGGVAVGVGFAGLAGYDSTLVLGTLIAGLGMVFQAVGNLLTVSLQGALRFGWIAVINITRQAIAVALIVALVLAGSSLTPFFVVTIPAGLATAVFAAWLVRGQMPLAPRLRGTAWWPLVRDTLPYGAAIAVNTLYFRVTIVVMSLVASAQQTGYFATSFRVMEVLIGIPGLAISAAYPILSRAARDDGARFDQATERVIELALIVGTALLLAVVLTAPFVVNVLAGSSGAPAGPVLQIQGLTTLPAFVSAATGFVLLSLRRHRPLLIANGAALMVNAVLTAVLVPALQARGAALAAVIAESAMAVGQLWLVLAGGRGRLRVSAALGIAVAGVAGAAPLLIPGLHPLVRGVGGLLIFLVVLAACGRFPPELGHLFRRGSRARPN